MKLKKIIGKKAPVKEVPKKKRISIQAAKSKGRNLQKLVGRKVADLLGEPFGPDEDIASRPMGQSGCDVRLSPRLLKKFPYSIECKCQERFNIVTAIKQAVENQIEGTNWLLFFTKNRFPTTVIMECDHFFDLLERLRNAKAINRKKL